LRRQRREAGLRLSHLVILDKPEMVNGLILDFLATTTPATLDADHDIGDLLHGFHGFRWLESEAAAGSRA